MAKVLISEKVAEEGIEFLKQKGYTVKIGRGIDKAALIEDIGDCEAIMVRVAKIDNEIFDKAPKLKVVAKHGVGVDNIDLDAAKKHGCRVVYTPTANSLSVAEQAIGFMTACAKQFPRKTREYAKGNYGIKDTSLSTELFGKTLQEMQIVLKTEFRAPAAPQAITIQEPSVFTFCSALTFFAIASRTLAYPAFGIYP